MNCAIKLGSTSAVKEIQSRRAELLEEIDRCEIGLEHTLDMPWPQNVWQQRFLTNEIDRLREEIRDLGRNEPPAFLMEQAI